MATGRSRSFDNRSNFTGTYQNITIGSTTTRSLATGLNGTCDDTIGNFPNANGLAISSLNRQYPGLVGERINALTGMVDRRMNNFPVAYHPDPIDPRSVFPNYTTLEKNNLAWRILSEANPSAPDVSLPTFIAELKDLPSLMKYWNRAFIESHVVRNPFKGIADHPAYWDKLVTELFEIAAAGHLTWRWAVKPFVRDFNLMLEYTRLFDKRLKMLDALARGRTIRRKVVLAENHVMQSTPGVILHSEGIVLRGSRRVAFTEKAWGTVKYKLPGGKLFPAFGDSNRARARRLLFGITSHEALATAWELMPWSWLVDWFAGIGTVIKATNNTLGLVHSDCCLMRHTKSEGTCDIDTALSEGWARPNKDWFFSHERKERFLVTPVIPFAPTYLPICTAKAWSILGSLTILQARPGRHLKPYRFLENRK